MNERFQKQKNFTHSCSESMGERNSYFMNFSILNVSNHSNSSSESFQHIPRYCDTLSKPF